MRVMHYILIIEKNIKFKSFFNKAMQSFFSKCLYYLNHEPKLGLLPNEAYITLKSTNILMPSRI